MTLKRTAAILSFAVGLLFLVGLFVSDGSSISVNGQELEGPLRYLALGAGVLLAPIVGGLILAGAGTLIVGVLAAVGVLLLLIFAPFLAPVLLLALVVYLLARRRKEPSISKA